MRFSEALQSRAGTLTDADRRIGNTILGTPHVAGLTAAELAARADVHESSVVRFAQKLGYDGFPSLRAELIADFERQVDVASARSHVGSADRDPSLVAIVAAQTELLHDLPRMIPQSSIDAAAKMLWDASQVLVIGRGLMTAPATFMARKLRLLGIKAVHAEQGGADAVEHSATLSRGDAVLVFAFSDEYAGLAALITALGARGVHGVLVTDQAALLEHVLPDVVMPVPRRQSDHGVMAAITVVGYAIEYAMVALRPDAARVASDEIVKLAASGRLNQPANDYQQITTFERGSSKSTH